MRRLGPALLAPLLLAAATPTPPVEYLVAPIVGADGLERIAVTIRFRGDTDGETGLALPDRWAGSERLHDAIEALAVDGGTIAADGDPARRTIRHAPGAALTVRYSIGPSASEPGAGYEKARPVVRPGWFYLHGEGVLATPEGRSSAPARLRLAPEAEGWRWAANVHSVESVDDAVQSILAGGTDLRLLERDVQGRTLRIALRGSWSFTDAAFADGLARILAAANDYMDSPAIPYFVSLAPLAGAETGAISFGGTGRTGGFALAATVNVGLDQFLPTLAHEYGHRWFGRSLGPVPDPDAPDYWFTEGFNDYVAGLALVRSGVWQPRDYAGRLNQVLLRYASSPARTLTNEELAERFWSDPDAQQAPYDRGHLFALAIDSDGRVRRALQLMALRPEAFPPHETQAARLARAAAVEPGALRAMLRGEPIALPADALAACGAIVEAEQPIYASGYTAEARGGRLYFATVDEGSPAWAAGLRPGMHYLRRESFRPGDSTVPIVMRVADESGERLLSWLPQGRQLVRFQRLVLSEADGAGCRARLGGA